jgi:hypothetical protein
MFRINEDLSIECTRGDAGVFSVGATIGNEVYKFKAGDVVRFTVFGKKDCSDVVLQKDVTVAEETEEVEFLLEREETKLGGVISKPVDYWYEVELNPETYPQTIIGYDENGAKVFKLYPEGVRTEG